MPPSHDGISPSNVRKVWMFADQPILSVILGVFMQYATSALIV